MNRKIIGHLTTNLGIVLLVIAASYDNVVTAIAVAGVAYLMYGLLLLISLIQP